MAGVAAYCVNEFDLAGPWLKTAEASGRWSRDMQANMPKRHYANYPEMIDLTKAGWAKEKKIREAEAKANDLPR